MLQSILTKPRSKWTSHDVRKYNEYIYNGIYNSVSVDHCEPMLEQVWTIQKVQKDEDFNETEREAYNLYLVYVKLAMKFISQSTTEEKELYDVYMNKAIVQLKKLYHHQRDEEYKFSRPGHKDVTCRVPGVPIYVTECNYLSRYIHIFNKTYYVFWTHSDRINIAYVSNETRNEFDELSAMLAYDFTCQPRNTLAHETFAYVPHNPPKDIELQPPTASLWTSCQDGRSNSGVRQLVQEDEVTASDTALSLMSYGLKHNVFTYAHKIGCAIWLDSSESARILYVWSGLYQARDRSTWTKRAKEISLSLKPIIRVKPKELCKLVEADSLANRHEEDELDWQEEKRIRTTPVDNLIPVDYIYREAKRLFSIKKANGVFPVKQDVHKFLMELPMTIPEGAWYEPDLPRDPKLRSFLSTHGMTDNVAGSKAIHILNCTPSTIEALLRKPKVDVTTQVKVEWSKLRALYPTDVASNLQCAFVAGEVEKFLPVNCLIGAGYSDEKVAKIINWYEETGYGISAGQDYKGFNEQHKKESMKAVMQAWIDVYGTCLHPDQLSTMNTIRDNFDRHFIKFPDGSRVLLKDTLMSGSRWTTFLNTMFNYIYSRFIHSIADVEAVTFHVGDDVYGRYKTLQDAERVIYFANRLNVHMQVNKCFVYGSSEFLRKQYIRGSSYQYLCRSIATLVHSRWERDEPVRLKDRLEGIYTRMLNFTERGGKFSAIRWGVMLGRVSCGKLHDIKIQYMLSLPSSRGGIRSQYGKDKPWSELMRGMGLLQSNPYAYIIEDPAAVRDVYRRIEGLPLIKFSAYALLKYSRLPLTLYKKMKSFLSHRFSSSVKFDSTRLVIDSTFEGSKALARYVSATPALDYTYSRIHPYVRAMYAARRRGQVRRWFFNMLR